MMFLVLLAAVFSVETVRQDGSSRVESVSFPETNGVVRFVRPLAQIPKDVRRIRVTPDFARARTGEDGYFVFGNMLGTYRQRNGRKTVAMPIAPFYGMKTPRRTFIAIGTGMPWSFAYEAVAKDGEYTTAALLDCQDNWTKETPDRPYEDFVVEFRFLKEADADYSGMARAYRAYQLDRGACRPLAARAKERPELAYAARCPEVRIRQAWKPVPSPVKDQVDRNEPPVKPVVTFDRVREIVDESVRQGIRAQEICLVGWNAGGHDGRYPQIFPVEPTLGGEEKLKSAIAHAQAKGYQIVGHASFRDCYLIADTFDAEFVVEKNPDGSLRRADRTTWGGGTMYTMCPQRAYERFAPKQCAQMAALGFRGLFYIDVTTSRALYPCLDPRHPLNNGQRRVWEINILNELTRHFGGAASEGGYDWCIGAFDSALTIQWVDPFKTGKDGFVDAMFDRHIPMWQLVYNGICLSTPYRTMINVTANPDRRCALKLAEFGGRPTYYWHSRFVTGRRPSMGEIDLEATTDAKLRQSVRWVKEGCDEYDRRSDLQFVFMDRHERLAEGVFRVTYSNGAKMYVNYNESPHTAEGVTIPPLDYAVSR